MDNWAYYLNEYCTNENISSFGTFNKALFGRNTSKSFSCGFTFYRAFKIRLKMLEDQE